MDHNRDHYAGEANVPGPKKWIKEEDRTKQPLRDTKIAYECISKIIELDTENVVSELSMLESVNNSSILKFRDLGMYSQDVLANTVTVHDGDEQLRSTLPDISKLGSRVDTLHRIALELDEWSHELQVKLESRNNKQRNNNSRST